MRWGRCIRLRVGRGWMCGADHAVFRQGGVKRVEKVEESKWSKKYTKRSVFGAPEFAGGEGDRVAGEPAEAGTTNTTGARARSDQNAAGESFSLAMKCVTC